MYKSEPMQKLSSLKNLKKIKKLCIKAEELNYFCSSDLKNMKNIEIFEFFCHDFSLELNLVFEDFARFPMLKQVIIDVNADLEERIEVELSMWEEIDNLQMLLNNSDYLE